eukprot:TRINITY_DN979_c0_g3_i1.p1 TRINITY_DN979_c0_g3~~TRINITY_DN979_c0_g3_i1.p1  ORF type:complete len:207 (-),score=17.06 TRINITY_DN979_c0_g3_i1:8-628(-)
MIEKELTRTKFGVRLSDNIAKNSFVLYIFPTFFLPFSFVVAMVTGYVVTANSYEYKLCVQSNTDLLRSFLIGSIMLNYTFILLVAQTLFDLFISLKSKLVKTIFIECLSLIAIIWSLFGASSMSGSECKSTMYYKISIINVVYSLISSFALLIVLVLGMCISRGAKTSKVGVTNNDSAVKAEERNASPVPDDKPLQSPQEPQVDEL